MFSSSKYGSRKFYELPNYSSFEYNGHQDLQKDILDFVHKDIIGKNCCFTGPYGVRTVLYCDHIASSRALNSIESYIKDYVLPYYGNTHTTTTVTSLQSTMYQQEARTIIRNAIRANEHDAVIFTGNGATSAVHKLIKALDLKSPPVVFVGPFEHHSNLLPWREIAAHIIAISENSDGFINLEHLELALQEWHKTDLKMIGCFSAASNITGIITDTISVSELMHKYGGLAFWDYATGGPYLDIDMHPHHNNNAHKDAVFLSLHKFVGGVDAPGVLVAKRSLFQSSVPDNAGGGSVFFVTRDKHRYLLDEETREEGGTPRVVGIVRAGLAFQLKQSISSKIIMKTEEKFCLKALEEWKNCSNLHMLGNCKFESTGNDRLAIFSFMIYHPPSKLYLHHNFVSAILNDIFGIQARGGCACAGPYAQELLGIDEDTADKFEKVLLQDSRLDRVHLRRTSEHSHFEVLRPGFVRISIPYFATFDEASYVIRAVAMVSELGWKCLPVYKFNPETGEWRHVKHKVFADRLWISSASFTGGGLRVKNTVEKPAVSYTYEQLLKMAEDIFQSTAKVNNTAIVDQNVMFTENANQLRWFLLPSEAQSYMIGSPVTQYQHKCPISVRRCVKQLSKSEMKAHIKIPSDVELPYTFQKFNLIASKSENCCNNTSLKNVDEPTPSCDIKLGSCVKIDRNLQNKSDNRDQTKFRFVPPPKRLFKLTAQAIEEFNMIENSDRVLVCLSGGKDSLSLLHVLHQYQFYSKKKGISFELGAVTIDPITSSYDPSPLIPYLKALGVPYFYEKQDILDEALRTSASSICSFCSRMKRGRIYACARREGWNVLAFGQHLDDLAESFIMSAFHNGLLRTMKANYFVAEGDLRVIRPFVYVRETDTRQFAEGSKLPIIPENCPACFEAPKERHRVKQLLASQEIIHNRLFPSLKEAMHPLMSKNKTGMESKNKLN